jgi:Zn-dependent protease
VKIGFDNPGLMQMAYFGVSINIFLALFNLIPIPPLDGSHILALFLPRELARLYAYLQPVGFILILILFYTGIMSAIIMPLYRQIALIMLG